MKVTAWCPEHQRNKKVVEIVISTGRIHIDLKCGHVIVFNLSTHNETGEWQKLTGAEK